jgi:hypothetical protein
MTRFTLMIPLAFVAMFGSCSVPPPTRSATSSNTNDPLAVKNFTGSPLRAVYLSHSGAPGWEENILGPTDLQDGETLNINFAADSNKASWDLRVEGIDGHYAEWKNVNLDGASRITLLLRITSRPVVVAEIE